MARLVADASWDQTWAPAGLVVDMDGVLYRGDTPLAGLAEFAEVSARWPRVLLTNNSTLAAADCVRKLLGMGVVVDEPTVLTVSEAVGELLATRLEPGSRVYVLGERPLHEAVRAAGMIVGGRDSVAAVVGLDRELRYEQLRDAMHVVRLGHPLFVTSLDPVLLTAEGMVPGGGAIVAALRACTDAEPVCVGKPNPRFFVAAARRVGVPIGRVLVIGDSLTSDIAGGRAAGARTALMLSGVTPRTSAERAREPRPDLVFSSLPELTGWLEAVGPPADGARGEPDESLHEGLAP